MRLFLVRHGETVDNVAGLYAGSRDSELTAHGVLQARRLGSHLATRARDADQVFTSDLQRAYRTAEMIAEAQETVQKNSASAFDPGGTRSVNSLVVRLPELRERDFGSDEGKRFGTRPKRPIDDPGRIPSESHESMRSRVDKFLDERLLPKLAAMAESERAVIIVSHGIILNVLLRAITARFQTSRDSRPSSVARSAADEEFFAAWSNTGYLEAMVTRDSPSEEQEPIASVAAEGFSATDSRLPAVPSSKALDKLNLCIVKVNCVDHLQGLKKTRGGIGNAKFDSKQKTMDSFFSSVPKKRKFDADAGAEQCLLIPPLPLTQDADGSRAPPAES